ncbi:dATP/dGTP diphosphohydrolase domain-containing protein [Pseudovibrio sp. SPO723]|uniref:dATP/dGTP diphosphohydrolase domain-containing protein n=1 Tax=Nesiotobacter zosterae TaxID=392721 RepID=UPI0029C5998F|nr:dATP/dGTP diphosphohydrolase domain-containing protein [Pseudovibrio sp. SPO723]MDX5592591.1 dATP/dGTP diphosphohydrolase domain-containing protein [Pseudovibrio sp. SPO723]
MSGLKDDKLKPMPALLFVSLARPLAQVVDVLTFGARKYAPDNWSKVEKERYWDALYRHLGAFHRGEKEDPETGIHHLAHAACNILFLLWHETSED